MKTLQWVIVVAPLMVASGTILQGCTTDMCPTEEEKAAAKANGTELVEGEDCAAEGQNANIGSGQAGAGGMPGQFSPELFPSCIAGAGVQGEKRPRRADYED